MKKYFLLLALFLVSLSSFSHDTIQVGSIDGRILLQKHYSQEMRAAIGREALLRFNVQNNLQKGVSIDLNIPSADSIVATIVNKNTNTIVVAGPYVSALRWPFPEDPGIIPIDLKPGEAALISVKVWSDQGRPFSLSNISLQTRQHTLQNSVAGFRDFMGRTEFNGFFLGATVFAMLFFLLIWLKVGQRVFLFYSLYLLGAAAYSVIVKTLPYSYLTKLAYIDYPLTYKLGEPVQYLFFAAYIAFARELLDVSEKQKALYISTKIFAYALVSAGAGMLAYNFHHFDYRLQQQAFIVSRLVILPVALVMLFWIIAKVNSPVKWFFIAGSSLFFLGGLLAVIVDPKSRHLFFGMTNLNPVNFFKTGILLECLCFALALGYKIRIQQKERDEVTRAYIAQLELNRQMSETENQRLEKMVSERTKELLEKTRVIEDQKRAQLQAGMEKQLAEMEMRALRSQMNPHFIFNSLNSIRYEILRENYEAAVTYLNSFSRLLRYVLQNAREHLVSLSEELEMNRLYVQLEKLRFSQGFEFVLDIAEDVDISGLMVPPMLLQPYIENAVKHGLLPSQNLWKKLSVLVRKSDAGYQIVIEDNGIGRAPVPKSVVKGKQPLGMVIGAERIALFNSHYKPRITMEVDDLLDGEGHPGGTRILFNYHIHGHELLGSTD